MNDQIVMCYWMKCQCQLSFSQQNIGQMIFIVDKKNVFQIYSQKTHKLFNHSLEPEMFWLFLLLLVALHPQD